MDEVIDDLISLESSFNDGGLDCMEPNIIMQNNVSMNYSNYSHIVLNSERLLPIWGSSATVFTTLQHFFLVKFLNSFSVQWGPSIQTSGRRVE